MEQQTQGDAPAPKVRNRKTRFARWLARSGRSLASVARDAGVSAQAVRDARDSYSRSARIAGKIATVTGGAVTVADLCGGR